MCIAAQVVGRAEPHNLALIHPEQDRVLTIRENARTQVGFTLPLNSLPQLFVVAILPQRLSDPPLVLLTYSVTLSC